MTGKRTWVDNLPPTNPNMSKRSFLTHCTALPDHISRDKAVAYLHDHEEMIRLNPLVLRHERTSPPQNAPQEEVESMTWYEITDEIQYLPGTPLKGEVSYKAGFYDLPNGLQTHTFAPAGVDLRGKWIVGGNMPGEEPEHPEFGVEKPREGLYIREDQEIRCNVFLTNFIKRNIKKSHATVADTLVKRAGGGATSKPQSAPQSGRPDSIRSASEYSSYSATSSPSSAFPPGQTAKSPQNLAPQQRDASGHAKRRSWTPYSSRPGSCTCSNGVHVKGCLNSPAMRKAGLTQPSQQTLHSRHSLESQQSLQPDQPITVAKPQPPQKQVQSPGYQPYHSLQRDSQVIPEASPSTTFQRDSQVIPEASPSSTWPRESGEQAPRPSANLTPTWPLVHDDQQSNLVSPVSPLPDDAASDDGRHDSEIAAELNRNPTAAQYYYEHIVELE